MLRRQPAPLSPAAMSSWRPTLKPAYADILWRTDLIGESCESIAAALNISESNLRVCLHLHRARQARRKRPKETCRTCPIHGYLDCNCDYGAHLRAQIGQDTPKL